MLVVSPLIALIRDQVGSITAMGITATYISDKEAAGSKERKQAIKNGMFQIVFISPEALILLKWLRKEFSDLGEIRSIVPRCVRLLCIYHKITLYIL